MSWSQSGNSGSDPIQVSGSSGSNPSSPGDPNICQRCRRAGPTRRLGPAPPVAAGEPGEGELLCRFCEHAEVMQRATLWPLEPGDRELLAAALLVLLEWAGTVAAARAETSSPSR